MTNRKIRFRILSAAFALLMLISGNGDLLPRVLSSDLYTRRQTLTASDGSEYTVTVTYDSDSGIPEDAVLSVREIGEKDEGYEGYLSASLDKLGRSQDELLFAKAFDISLRDPVTGEEFQPAAGVSVSVRLLKENLEDSAQVDVVHLGGEDGLSPAVMSSTVQSGAVEFSADGFSVYVLVGTGSSVPMWRYTFMIWSDTLGTYEEIEGTDQRVKNGETPIIPQPVSGDTREFVGWYTGHNEGADVILDELFDFDNVPPFTEDGATTLYAKFAHFAYVVFHDQYDAAEGLFPIMHTRRAELEEGTDSVSIRIDDLRSPYTGGENMAFCGWSRTAVSTPGIYRDPDTNEPYSISWTEGDPDAGCVSVNGELHLYPVYRPIHWLTLYSAQSGLDAVYVPPIEVFDGEGLTPPLPVTSRDGYTFTGWYTGALVTETVGTETVETVNYGSRVTDEDGNLLIGGMPILSGSDGGVSVLQGKLYLSANATLYAKWQATYNLVIWKQDPAESPDLPADQKHYLYHTTVRLPAEIGETVSVPNGYKTYGGSAGFECYAFSRCDDPKVIANSKTVTVMNVYYDLNTVYQPSGDLHTLTFTDSVTGAETSPMPAAVTDIPFGARISELSAYPVAVPADRESAAGHVIFRFRSWYMDPDCTVAVDLSEFTMPDRDLTLYAGWSAEWFIVNIDPNYGALYYYDGGLLKGSGSTWFWQTYDNEPIGEYTHAVRDYVASGSGHYYYVKRDRSFYGYSGNEWDNSERDRQTFYTTDISQATEDTAFEYAPGSYSYIGWYEVFPDGGESDKPYDFTQHTDHDITLKLHWKRTGSFYLAFDAGDGTLDGEGTKKDTVNTLQNAYADYADVVISRVANAPGGHVFVGWRVKGSEGGRIYPPGHTFTLHAEDADRESGRDVIWLEAVYDKLGAVTLTYHANGGTVLQNALDYGSIPGSVQEEPPTPVSGRVEGDTVTVSGLENNSRFTLGSGAGFSRENAVLAGWSDKPVCDSSACFYAPGETVGVDLTGNTDLYAVWQFTVTYHLNNPDAEWGSGWDGYDKDDGTDTYSQTVYAGNPVSEPAGIPRYVGAGTRMFCFWTSTAGEDTARYDFTSAVEGKLDLYAFWRGPIEVPVRVLDSTGRTIAERTAADGWEIHPVQATEQTVALPGAGFVTPPAGSHYKLAFVAAYGRNADPDGIGKEEEITSVYFNQTDKHLHVTYADGSDGALSEDTDIFFVYYEERELPIGYKNMDAAGVLSEETVDGAAPLATGIRLGEFTMSLSVTDPMGWAAGSYTCYAFAIGDTNAPDASQLQMITDTAGAGDPLPALSVRSTWRGYEYSTDGGTHWVDCGYDPQLYVIYFTRKPTVIMIHQETVGVASVMDVPFEYHIVVTQPGSVDPVYDSDNNEGQTDLYSLKNGDAQSVVLFYGIEGGAEVAQTVTVTQKDTAASADFTTLIGDTEQKVWSYTSTAAGGTVHVTFTNRHNALSVNVHVAVIEGGSILLKDDEYRSAAHSFLLPIGQSGTLSALLPSDALFTGPADSYGLGGIVYGTHSGATVDVKGTGLTTMTYGQAEGNLYNLLLNGTDPLDDSYNIYYVYYPIPRIRYMKNTGDGLIEVEGAQSGAVTYNGSVLQMNGVYVEQGQRLTIPAGGTRIISQNGNHFRMPPNLDDGSYARYLVYDLLAVGDEGQTNLGSLTAGEGFTLYLRVQKNGVQFSFNGSDWSTFTGAPTVYAIYEERGYDLKITKTVDTSVSGANPIFTGAVFSVTVFSQAITKDSYPADGYHSAFVSADPVTHTILLPDVEDGTSVRIKGLGQGDYTVTESGNENYVLSVKKGPIVTGSHIPDEALTVSGNSSVSFTLDAETKLDLTNTPRRLCKIPDGGVEHVFYTFADAFAYVENNIPSLTADVEMLSDYLMPAQDAAEIPNGFHITLKTADSGTYVYEGAGKAVITRSGDLTDSPLFRNGGSFLLQNVILDGNGVAASKALIESVGDLTVGTGSVLRGGNNSGDGGAVCALAGNVTVDDGVIGGEDPDGTGGNSAARGAGIFYAGSGTVTLLGGARVSGNSASGDGGGIYAVQGTLSLSGTAAVEDNLSGAKGGGVYAGNAIIELKDNASVSGNTAMTGGGVYADTVNLTVSKTEGVNPPSVSDNRAMNGDGGGIYADKGSVSLSGGTVSGNEASVGRGGGIRTGSASVSVSGTASFSSNSAQSGGGIYAQSGSVTADGGSMTGNAATSGDGGGIYAGSGALSLARLTLSGNTAEEGAGGAVYADGGVVTAAESTLSGNSARNGGGLYAATGSVTLTDTLVNGNSAVQNGGGVYAQNGGVTVTMTGAGSLINNTATSGNGGAVYAEKGSVTLTNGGMTGNRATAGKGGGVYAVSGSVTLNQVQVNGNGAGSDGGAVATVSGSVRFSSCAEVAANYSSGGNGGVICTVSGDATLVDSVFGDPYDTARANSARSGGAVFTDSGTVSVTNGSISGNRATVNGGGVGTAGGSVTFTGVTADNNTAGQNGGAVYSAAGAVTVNNGVMSGNSAASGNGGGICAAENGVTLSSAVLSGNTAPSGNGGGFYSGAGSTGVSGGTVSGNSASNGGAFYVDEGNATLNGINVRENVTDNGSAIFVNKGTATFSNGEVTANVSENGGGVGIGDTAARLYLSGNVVINGNTKGSENANIYLDQDANDIINISGIDKNARIGVYVPDELTTSRDVPGARFAVYSSNTNVTDTTVFDDHTRFGFTVEIDTAAKKLFWAKNIRVEVTYLASFSAGLPSASNRGTSITYIQKYCPIIDETSSVSMSELVNDVYNKFSSSISGKLSVSAIYGGSFAYGDASFGLDIVKLIWNVEDAVWDLQHRDGTTTGLADSNGDRRIYLIYSEPAYIAIENNTDKPLSVSELTVSGTAFTDQNVINGTGQIGFGMLFARNGAIRSALLPVTSADLTLPVGASVTLLIPGGQGMSYKLNGSFTVSAADECRLRLGEADPLSDQTLQIGTDGSFLQIQGTLPASAATYQIIFGDDKYICKVSANGSETPFSKISAALSYIQANQLKGTPDNPVSIEMLTDYLLRRSDPVSIPQGYNIRLTTAVDGIYQYPFDPDTYDPADPSTHPRATISRDADNLEAMVSAVYTNESVFTSLEVEYLIFDGKGIKGNTKGGAIKTKNCRVTARYMDVKNIYAENGGAIYAEGGLSRDHSVLTAENCFFYKCNSTINGGRNGGGAIHAYLRVVNITDCQFDSCEGYHQAGAVFHRIDSGNDINYDSRSNIIRCSFTNCTSRAAGGLELDSKTILVDGCTFQHCIATERNGGGFNIYVFNQETPSADCSTTVRNCVFDDCRLTSWTGNRGNGGGFRCNSLRGTIENCRFTNTYARYGGAVSFTNGNATQTNVYGCVINGCTAADFGGGIYSNAKSLVIGDYTYTDDEGNEQTVHTSITNCTATNNVGGGVYYNKDGAGSLSVTNAVITGNSCPKSTGGGISTNSKTVSFSGCTISNNTSKNSGGGAYLSSEASGSTFTVTDTDVNGNVSTDQTGGGVFTKAATVSVTGGSVSNNTSNSDGGGIYASAKTSLTLSGVTLSGNVSRNNSGGALWYDSASGNNDDRAKMKLTVTDCVIEGNSGNFGGGVFTRAKTVTVSGGSLSYNTGKSNGGGIYHDREIDGSALTFTGTAVNGNRITNNNALGGGVYSNARTLTFTGGSVSDNTAAGNGGGVWYDGTSDASRAVMALTLSGCAVDGNTSGVSGGGIFTRALTVTVGDDGDVHSSLSRNKAALNGGGLYHSNSAADSSVTVTGADVKDNEANGTGNNGMGGGIFTNALTLTLSGSEISANTARNHGGGVWYDGADNDKRAAMSLSATGCTFNGNVSSGNGGAVYTGAYGFILQGDASGPTRILNCTAGLSGGGVYHSCKQDSVVTRIENARIENCASNATGGINVHVGGGGVFSNAGSLLFSQVVMSGNTASHKGGGLLYAYDREYAADRTKDGLVLDHCSFTGNAAGSQGGGIYTRSFVRMFNDCSVTDNRLSSGSADNAAGMYLPDRTTLILGVLDAEGDTIHICDNFTGTGAPSNLRLWSNSDGQNNADSVEVNCNLNGLVRVVNANKVGTQFGEWEATIDATQTGLLIDNSDAVFKADYDTFYGGINRSDLTRRQIIWVGPAVCKITDDEGNLLYLKYTVDGEGHTKGTDAAIFDKLDDNNADGSITSAFNILRNADPVFFNADGTPYTGTSFCVKMLDSFTTESPIKINYYEGRSITLTTAGRDDADYPFEYDKTYKSKVNTATVMKGSGVGNNILVDTAANFTLDNVILDGGSLEGNLAGNKSRLLNVNHDGITVTLRGGAILQNAETTGNGGGVYVNRGTLKIGDATTGAAIRNCHGSNGGGIYSTANGTLDLIRGNIIQCGATNDGGGVYVQDGSGSGILNFKGGSIERCTAGRDGGGLYLGQNRHLHMSGANSRIAGNTAGSRGGGIAIGGGSSRLFFSEKPTVTGNTADGHVCNLELDVKSLEIIQVEGAGLFNGANIGVYVPGTEGTDSCYDLHGMERKAFGIYAEGSNAKTLYSFINDRNGLKGGLISGSGGDRIFWVKIFSLEVKKQGRDIPADERFVFEVRLTGAATVQGQLDAKDIDGEFGGMVFHSDGVGSTTAEVTLELPDGGSWEDGVNCVAENLSDGLLYTVTERLSAEQIKKYAALPAQISGTVGENNREGVEVAESERYISRTHFRNVLAVCKLTDKFGKLLYYVRQGSEAGEPHIPAVYTTLREALDALEHTTLYSAMDYNAPSYAANGGVQIHMLVGEYLLPESFTVPAGMPVTLTTAASTATDTDKFTYRGEPGTVTRIIRDYAGGSMFTAEGALTLTGITLDGAKSTYSDSGNGGIVLVNDGGSLTLGLNALLTNSKSTNSGGGVYVSSGGSLTMTGGSVENNEAVFGGGIYVRNGGTAAMSGGTVQNNRAVKSGGTGNGGGIYLASGSRLELSGNPGFGSSTDSFGNISSTKGNLAAVLTGQKNGGETYPVEHQDIYIAESEGDPASLVLTDNLIGNKGSVWVWSDSLNRYGMASPFARIGFSGTVTETTYSVFRNAQTNQRTFVSDGKYLTGDPEREKDGFIHWTGGFDVLFDKIDGFGEKQSGAVFTLYTDPACTQPFQRNGTVTATSADGSALFHNAMNMTLPKGAVLFEKLPAGVYYVKETASSAGTVSNNVYLLLAGQAELGRWSAYGIADEADVTRQTAGFTLRFSSFGVKGDYALFLLDAVTGNATSVPDVARYGVMNLSPAKRKVIFRKTDDTYSPLSGAVFEVLRYDMTPVIWDNDRLITSDVCGVFNLGELTFGYYYLHETGYPDGVRQNGANGWWYTVRVDAQGVTFMNSTLPAASPFDPNTP